MAFRNEQYFILNITKAIIETKSIPLSRELFELQKDIYLLFDIYINY